MEVVGIDKALKKFKGKKVFITGHTGFKGSWLTYLLDQNGAITKGYSLKPNTNPSLYLNLKLSKNHFSIYSDINDYASIRKEIRFFKPDFIFHLAAQPLVLESYDSPMKTFETNFNGTLNLLNSIKEELLSCIAIFITTDKVYENNELNIPFSEEDKLGGNDPYSASKSACELLINSYQKSFFNNTKNHISTARAGNVIGGGDWSKDRLIPDIIRSIYENKNLEIRNLNSTRPWQHVLEPLYGYLKLALQMKKNPVKFLGSWNFGPETSDSRTVKEIVDESNISFQYDKGELKEKVNEAKYLSLNIDKAKEKLNWKPKWKSEIAIKNTLNWYKDFYEGISVNELIKKDFKLYSKQNK